MSQGLSARAFAKINLGLEVLGLRPDGYHEIRTILQTIDLHDELSYSAGEGIDISCNDGELPTGSENLVHKAAKLLADAAGIPPNVSVYIRKRIPAGSGLGGGSADAAVTLLALDRLWKLSTPFADLHRVACRIGMDVPFFLRGGTALAVGRGDEVYPLAFEPDFDIVLILPDFSISTATAYRSLRLTNKGSSLKLAHFAWGDPTFLEGLGELVNDLEGAAGEHSGSIRECKQILCEQGAAVSMMSGSGSCVFGVFRDEARAREAARSLGHEGVRVVLTRTLRGQIYREKLLAVPD
ncbi:MAG TPA: 4-(cytidine 5'-diphospho)-2-C-methyl-D-erythritol kinase [Vicinamibacteria bacterium]|nr:4-(cytidine 5'-diphospho)-2-C-methyl-D-erythritol kinase [Vicinamibacteria bacterium]